MTLALCRSDVERFRAVVVESLGLQFEDGRLDYLTEVLRERLERSSSDDLGSYLRLLRAPSSRRAELRSLIERLTVNETYFFRNSDQFRALGESVLPELARLRASSRRLRVLSAACASGEEAYSIAIALRESPIDLNSWDVSLHGIDVNPAMIVKAERARYSTWSFRETPPETRDRYFSREGPDLALSSNVRAMVSFEERNLIEDDPTFWQEASFDLVFCRNVTMYFSPEATRAVVARITRCLSPGGFLFLGPVETLRGISHDFHLRQSHNTFFYQRRELTASAPPVPSIPWRASEPAIPTELSDSWIDVIHSAAARIDAMARDHEPRPAASAVPASTPASSISAGAPVDLRRALELLGHERYSEAIDLLRATPAAPEADVDTQLVLASLFAIRGDLARAEQICARILELDELNAGARYVMALCRDHAGDVRGAIHHDQAAIYLDSAFAMPHLHLGLLAKRNGDLESAQRELGQALDLLAREDSSRILLFGGGFRREALMELCRQELRRNAT